MSVREAMAFPGLHILLMVLLPWLFSTVVDGSPLDMADMPIQLNFQDKHDATDRTDQDAGAEIDPLIRIHHHHIGKRDTHHELFEPRNEIVLDWRLCKLPLLHRHELQLTLPSGWQLPEHAL
jgi:hypothetical protein